MINPPIVLYYAQGINTTPIHSHAALFGVYGLLAISLLLFSVRHIVTRASWSDGLLKWSFWGLNGGLACMLIFNLIPSGFYQFYFAVKHGLWFARSPEIASGNVMRTLSWARMVPDMIFSAGAFLLFAFLVRAISGSPLSGNHRQQVGGFDLFFAKRIVRKRSYGQHSALIGGGGRMPLPSGLFKCDDGLMNNPDTWDPILSCGPFFYTTN